MTDRTELYRRFAERFHTGKRCRPATEEQVAEAESALGVLWPESYRQFALTCGAVYSPSLLDLIGARKAGFSDVQQFLTPKKSVVETRRWRLEPAGECVAFASDCSGNWFAFRELAGSSPRADDAAVWRFDLENETVEVEAKSFEEWINRFLSL
jgi:SMI1/KNR4 family protein SUKH-1